MTLFLSRSHPSIKRTVMLLASTYLGSSEQQNRETRSINHSLQHRPGIASHFSTLRLHEDCIYLQICNLVLPQLHFLLH